MKARWITDIAPVARSSSIMARHEASRPRSICSKRASEELDGGRISTPTTSKSESKGSSLVPRLPETPVTRTVRLEGIVTWAPLRCSAKKQEAGEPAQRPLHLEEAEALRRPAVPDAFPACPASRDACPDRSWPAAPDQNTHRSAPA